MPIYPAADWRAGAHANLRLACTMGVGLQLSTPLAEASGKEGLG
jgi:predicted component of type VI protein secretion system